jgi:hypothetical protein
MRDRAHDHGLVVVDQRSTSDNKSMIGEEGHDRCARDTADRIDDHLAAAIALDSVGVGQLAAVRMANSVRVGASVGG